MTINSKTLQQLTGLSTRRLYHWVDTGVIPEEYVISGNHPGSGGRLEFYESVIEPVKFCITIADYFGKSTNNGVSTQVLQKLFRSYSNGQLHINDSIKLSWVVDDNY